MIKYDYYISLKSKRSALKPRRWHIALLELMDLRDFALTINRSINTQIVEWSQCTASSSSVSFYNGKDCQYMNDDDIYKGVHELSLLYPCNPVIMMALDPYAIDVYRYLNGEVKGAEVDMLQAGLRALEYPNFEIYGKELYNA